MQKVLYTLILLFITGSPALLFAQDAALRHGVTVAVNSAAAENQDDEELPLTFKNVIGNWTLKYSGNYG